MPSQRLTKLEELFSLFAQKQDDETAHEVYISLALLTTTSVKRVLGLLLDPTYVRNRKDFAEGLKKAYQRIQKDNVAERLSTLRGAVGLVDFTLELLIEAERQEQDFSLIKLEWPKELLKDTAVQTWLYEVYKPTMHRKSSISQVDPTDLDDSLKGANNENLKLSQVYWRELDLNSLELYRVGTTSFILCCEVKNLRGKLLVLKCLLFPYTQIALIADATYKYALKYDPKKLPMTAQAYASTDKWILMDFVAGPTLKEVLDNCRKLESTTPLLLRTGLLASIGQRLLETLSTLPPEIRHEDLTPSNIILVKKSIKTLNEEFKESDEYIKELNESIERIVLIDLGRNYLYTRKVGLVENREALFIAPEVREGSSTATSDLYSFGMILIELADPRGVRDAILPDSLYQYAPTLARFVEDLVDVKPERRLLIFSRDKKNLLNTFINELKVLPSDREVKPGTHLNLGIRQIEIKPEVYLWMQQIKNLFYPSTQLAQQRELWRLTRSSKNIKIARYSGWLYRWLVYCTIHWNLCFFICFVWGMRDIGVGVFPTLMNIAQVLIFHCSDNCVPVIDRLQAPGYHISTNLSDILANLPARLTIFSVMAQTKCYQNILAGLTARPLSGWRARVTEVTLRGSAICSLVSVFIANLVQPRWWLLLLVIGYATVCLNNFLCYGLATRLLKSARKELLSTVSPYDDQGVRAFATWGPTLAIYMVLLTAIAIGLQVHFLHDELVYVVLTVGVSVFVWLISRCIYLAPSIRGGLSRAFIAGERLETLKDRKKPIQIN